MSAETVFLILERLAKLGLRAVQAARMGDDQAVHDILPDPDKYPDEAAYQRIKRQAEADYPRP